MTTETVRQKYMIPGDLQSELFWLIPYMALGVTVMLYKPTNQALVLV